MDLFVFDVVDSTMNVAKNIITSPKSRDVFCVLAKRQSAGKGTSGRLWCSPEGNFYATYCFKYDTSSISSIVSLLTGFSVIKTLENYGVTSSIKWTNDILIGTKKVAGILCEIYHSYMMIGIGINFNTVPNLSNLEEYTSFFQPTTIKSYYDISVTMQDFALELGEILVHKLYDDWKTKQTYNTQELWKKYSTTFNRQINFILPDKTVISGKEIGITQEGFLIIKQQTAIETYHSGRITDIIPEERK